MSGELRKLLLVDAHAHGRSARRRLEHAGYDVVATPSSEESTAMLAAGFRPEAIVLGEPNGETTAAMALAAIRGICPTLPVVIMVAAEGARLGEFLSADVRATEIERAQVDAELAGALAELSAADPADHFVTRSTRMREIRCLVEQIADTDVSVLITGESGVGKEVVARHLHDASRRATEPFVKVNCAALPDTLLESELFGHERGAFTGADRRRPGKFELAGDGTIFLDEIGEVPAGTQAKLLQVLQDGCYYRLGGVREIQVNARVVASTNRNLEAAMDEGRFRPDLFFRLNVVRIEMPGLAERAEEIEPLVEHFMTRYAAEYGRPALALQPAHFEALLRHDWPGNVRELQNLVRRIVVLQDIEGSLATLNRRPREQTNGFDVDDFVGQNGELPPLKEVSRMAALEVEGELIRRALDQTNWNRRQAALLLQISYKALLYKIRDCGINAA